jgi:hypothetical protein
MMAWQIKSIGFNFIKLFTKKEILIYQGKDRKIAFKGDVKKEMIWVV